MCVYSEGRWESIVSQWQAHWPLELDGPGMIPAADKETASLRKYVPSCHLQEWQETVCRPSNQDINWRPLGRESHPLCRLKEPYIR